MALGAFDRATFLEFRSAKSQVKRRILLGRLIADNEPLTKTLVGQLLGKREFRRPGTRVARCPGTEQDGRIPGADVLEWEDALQQGRIGMAKALETLDLEKGKLSYHALRNIHYQLQVLMGATAVVKVERGREGDVRGVLASSYEDEDGSTEYFDAMTHEHRDIERGPVHDQEDLALARVEVEAEQRYREAVQQDPVGTFVEARLRFGARLREVRARIFSAFEQHVLFHRVSWWSTDDLNDALKARNLARMTVWAPGHGAASGLRGVQLGSEIAQSLA